MQDWQDEAQAWLLAKKQAGVSAHTLSALNRDLNWLADYQAQQQSELNRRLIISAIKTLNQKQMSASTIARMLSTWRQFCRHLQVRKLLANNPTEGIQAPKKPKRLPKALPMEPLNQLLNQMPTSAASERDQAICELLYGSGLRLSELSALNLDSLDLTEGWVSVIGKGNKIRHVPLTQQSILAIKRYLGLRHAAPEEMALFVGRSGKRLGNRQIQKLLQRHSALHGERHISPHMLRHSYASHMLQNAQNIRVVQELLGHSQLATTQIYTQLDFQHLAKAYDQAHPRAKRQEDDTLPDESKD